MDKDLFNRLADSMIEMDEYYDHYNFEEEWWEQHKHIEDQEEELLNMPTRENYRKREK